MEMKSIEKTTTNKVDEEDEESRTFFQDAIRP